MDYATLELISGCGQNVRFDEGQYLAREGDTAETFYAIRHGRVAIEIHVPERGPLVIQSLQEGERIVGQVRLNGDCAPETRELELAVGTEFYFESDELAHEM